MELLLNDLSVHGQFTDVAEFRQSLASVMAMRNTARRFGREVYVHRNVVNCPIAAKLSVFGALQSPTLRNERRAFLGWFTKRGPFWSDDMRHSPDDYLECSSEVVTETAVGEVAFCLTLDVDRRLVSFVPSNWECSPISVRYVSSITTDIEVSNYWQTQQLEAALQQAAPPIASWAELAAVACSRFQRLAFSANCFSALDGQPFAPGAAERIISRLEILNRLMGEIDCTGRRTPEGHRLYQDYFTGDRAWFSDSSDTEKNEFRRQLTFPHPEQPSRSLFCPWHGKVNSPTYRIHFAWPPERPGAPLFVAYVGLKITRH